MKKKNIMSIYTVILTRYAKLIIARQKKINSINHFQMYVQIDINYDGKLFARVRDRFFVRFFFSFRFIIVCHFFIRL